MEHEEQPLIPLEQVQWLLRRAKPSKRGYTAADVLPAVVKQKGICALTRTAMRFSGDTNHPLYAVVDHIDGRERDVGYQVLCHAINDLKHDIEASHFDPFVLSSHWQAFVDRWCEQVQKDADDQNALNRLCQEMRETIEYRAVHPTTRCAP